MGLIYALLAYLSWGLVVPVHFRLLDGVSAEAILAHRIVWSAVFVTILLIVLRRRLANPFPLRRRYALLIASAAAIAFNWMLYLVAVGSGHMLDASLGYFINPLVSVGLGALVLGERLRPVQWVSVGIALTGVVIALIMAGRLPLLSLGLAISFALYGLLRKIVGVDAMIGFFAETFLLLPVALPYVLLSPDAVPADGRQFGLLLLTGVTTALPLIWFAAAAQRLSLATLGLMQYLAPSCLMLLGIVFYGETLPPDRIVLFALIWLALLLYAGDSLRTARRNRAAVRDSRSSDLRG
ncbi:EamA family transporter RarD [Methylobacterium haplocladii]|uniref:Chloramphenicol resistance permease RarD n=1 Tax=Methylobacterium haplocladii TaxID=1176176 RepID=A0A512IKE7_9HYPH|nr:EamA family transporter RarD [Methylobacterium haplocladii]GEO98122.1 chloramphenicol resistance permease RarD [Methylobacterium haplocladii]GJD83632.1 Protein RarD [Methylobacterium haplocladii]GLS59028.1 chloramphenicol resistance permease RarD [Methylobacterium haplocladii]